MKRRMKFGKVVKALLDQADVGSNVSFSRDNPSVSLDKPVFNVSSTVSLRKSSQILDSVVPVQDSSKVKLNNSSSEEGVVEDSCFVQPVYPCDSSIWKSSLLDYAKSFVPIDSVKKVGRIVHGKVSGLVEKLQDFSRNHPVAKKLAPVGIACAVASLSIGGLGGLTGCKKKDFYPVTSSNGSKVTSEYVETFLPLSAPVGKSDEGLVRNLVGLIPVSNVRNPSCGVSTNRPYTVALASVDDFNRSSEGLVGNKLEILNLDPNLIMPKVNSNGDNEGFVLSPEVLNSVFLGYGRKNHPVGLSFCGSSNPNLFYVASSVSDSGMFKKNESETTIYAFDSSRNSLIGSSKHDLGRVVSATSVPLGDENDGSLVFVYGRSKEGSRLKGEVNVWLFSEGNFYPVSIDSPFSRVSVNKNKFTSKGGISDIYVGSLGETLKDSGNDGYILLRPFEGKDFSPITTPLSYSYDSQRKILSIESPSKYVRSLGNASSLRLLPPNSFGLYGLMVGEAGDIHNLGDGIVRVGGSKGIFPVKGKDDDFITLSLGGTELFVYKD